MNRKVQFTIFLSIFLLIYLGIHFFVVSALANLFSIPKNIFFYPLILILASSFPLSVLIERKSPSKKSRYFHLVSATWMGILLYLFLLLLIYQILDIFLIIPKTQAEITILSFALVLTVYCLINGSLIRIREIEIPMEKLKKEIKLVQLSDVHIGSVRGSNFLKEIVEKTNQLSPDIVIITGDLVDGTAPLTHEIINPINKLKAPALFVTGNHEFYEGFDNIFKLLKKTKLKLLRNSETNFQGVQFLGVNYSEEKNYLDNALKGIKIKQPSVLLYHLPTNPEYLSTKKINLQLAGHTHNGQIFPFNIFAKLAYPNVSGFYTSKNKKSSIYVSQGTGTWGPPMRLSSFNEITLIRLKLR